VATPKGGGEVSAALSLENVTKAFGGLVAVKQVSLSVQPGELVGLIGPNGAGKTTIFNLITGVYRPDSGEIRLDDTSISGRHAYQVARMGVVRTFQNIRLFPALSVLDNVRIALHARLRPGFVGSLFHTQAAAEREAQITDGAIEVLKALGLDAVRDELASALPYGQQRRLEIARAVAARPRVLLLDEPAAGMNPRETTDLMHLIHDLRDRFRLTILLIEHDMRVVMGICERVYVLDYGEVIAHGPPDEIRANPKVIEAYLGEPMQ